MRLCRVLCCFTEHPEVTDAEYFYISSPSMSCLPLWAHSHNRASHVSFLESHRTFKKNWKIFTLGFSINLNICKFLMKSKSQQ